MAASVTKSSNARRRPYRSLIHPPGYWYTPSRKSSQVPKNPMAVTGAPSTCKYFGRKRFQRFSPSASRNIATETATMLRSSPSASTMRDRAEVTAAQRMLPVWPREERPDGSLSATSPRYFDQSHGVDQAVGEDKVTLPRDRVVADDVAATWNSPALESLGLRIEAHDGVRRRAGLAVPDDVIDGGDAVGLGLRPARRGPLGHLAGRGIETTQIPAREVRVPDDVVARDRDPAWPRPWIRQGIFANLQRLRVDAAYLVGAERDVEHGALRAHGHAIGARFRRGRGEQLDLTRLRVEPPHQVGILHREPQDPALIEDQRVGILGLGVRHPVLGDRTRLRVELADEGPGVARVPDVAVLVLDQAMRPGVRRLEGIFLEAASLRIEPAEHVVHLARVPERSVPRRQGIVRPRPGRGHLPFLDRDPGGAGDHHAHGFVLFREVLGQVLRDRGGLIGGHGHSVIGHHPHDGAPALGRVAGAETRVEGVAAIAMGRDQVLALALGQLLARGRKGKPKQSGGDQRQT